MALITIKNDILTVTLDSVGAVLYSIVREGSEYLWQGDEKYWSERDVNLFPYIGRLTEGRYIYRGESYNMTIHGFCTNAPFEIEQQDVSSVSFVLKANAATLASYPFEFAFHIQYTLDGAKLIKTCTVQNLDSKTMFFGLGSHPGFNVPVCAQGSFEDWYLEFDEPSEPVRVDIDQSTYRFAGTFSPYTLKDGTKLPLRHELFDEDAVILHGTGKQIVIKSDKYPHSVRVSFPDMPFIGLWHMPKSDAPYVCIEPWHSLPSHSDYVEDIEKQEYILPLDAGKSYENTITIEIA